MRRFKFYAIGKGFDVDSYIGQYKIDYSRTWDKDKYEHSGLVKYLGNEYMLDIYEQEKIAYEYMKANKDALKALVNFKGIDLAMLSLSCEIQLD